MSTKISEIKIKGDVSIIETTASIESVAKSFYGIIKLVFCNGIESNFISIYTKNLGSIDVEELVKIKKHLGAQSLTLSSNKSGLIYILKYIK